MEVIGLTLTMNNAKDYRDNNEWRRDQEKRPTAELLAYKRSLVSFASRIDDSRPDALELYEKLLDRVNILTHIIAQRSVDYKDRDEKLAKFKRFFSELNGEKDAYRPHEGQTEVVRGARYDDPPPKHRRITPLVPSMPDSCLPGRVSSNGPSADRRVQPHNEPAGTESRPGSSPEPIVGTGPTDGRPINDDNWDKFTLVSDDEENECFIMEEETQKD